MPQAQTVSINKMRADAVLVMRGFFVFVLVPGSYLLLLFLPMVRDLPHVDLAPLRSPLVWLLVALTVAGGFVARSGTARMTAPYLWILVIGGSLTVIGAAFVVTAGTIALTKLAQDSVGVLLSAALILIVMLLSPITAAVRLLATRLPSDGAPLPTVLASPRPQRNAGDVAAPPKKRSPATVAYGVAAVALGIVAAVLVLWLLATKHIEQLVLALVLEFAAIYSIKVLWRRARKLAAIDADAALLNDPRRPILYLRSFQDDPWMLSPEWDLLVRTRYGRAGRLLRPGPIGTLLTSGGRLEENLARFVAPIGPFVAIGAPDEPLPQLGAVRAYFTTDTWQSAVIDWVDMAELIVKVAGPTRWIRWELDTILDRNAWPKLLILMPPSTQEDHAARWGNIVGALQDGPWGDALAGLDPREVVAMRLLDEGGLSVVTSDRRRLIDYVLAMRIMLHQMQTAVPA